MDAIAERVQTLGGVAPALAHDVVEESRPARATSARSLRGRHTREARRATRR